MKTAATLVMLFTLFSLNTFAQDYTQLSLPEGCQSPPRSRLDSW